LRRAAAVFAVVVVLRLPNNDNHGGASLVTTIMLLVVFGGISVGMREWFARRHRKGDAPHTLKGRIQELLTPAGGALAADTELGIHAESGSPVEPRSPTRT
jgi:hypothetical protein